MKRILDIVKSLLNEEVEDSPPLPPKGRKSAQEKPQIVKKTWGYEIWMANNQENNYCGKILHINKGHRFSMHFHRDKHETFYVLRGKAQLTIIKTETSELKTLTLEEGDCYVIDRLVPHQVEALEETEIIESSTFHKDKDSYRVWRDQHITYSI